MAISGGFWRSRRWLMGHGFVGIGWAAETEVDPGYGQRRPQSDLSLRERDARNRDSPQRQYSHADVGHDRGNLCADRGRSRIGPGRRRKPADPLHCRARLGSERRRHSIPQGVDLGIVRSDTLDYLEKKGFANNIKGQFTYITKLYNEEVHVVAPKSVHSLADLEGKKVSIDLPNGGTFVTAIAIFERLGIHPDFAYIEQRIAYDKLSKGELDAVVAVQGQPSKATTQIKDPNLHLVPIEYAKSLQSDYLPAQLTSDNYPNLIAKGEVVDTVAVPAVLAAFNWQPHTERYRRLARFVDAFFGKIGELQQPPFHPKWKEVALNAPLPGWVRFRPGTGMARPQQQHRWRRATSAINSNSS